MGSTQGYCVEICKVGIESHRFFHHANAFLWPPCKAEDFPQPLIAPGTVRIEGKGPLAGGDSLLILTAFVQLVFYQFKQLRVAANRRCF
jgi:hypothetical protein